MAVETNLTPVAIESEDYPIIQKPALGGERDVYASLVPARLLGYTTLMEDATGTPDADIVEWTFVALPTSAPVGPIIAVVDNKIRADDEAYAVVNFAGLSGTFQRPAWSKTPLRANFGSGRAVELTGTYVAPTSTGVATITNAKRGCRIALWEMPVLADFDHVGCTNTKKNKLPSRKSKPIRCGLKTARWVKPGETVVPELTVESLDFGPDEGLNSIAGQNVVAMIVDNAEDELVRSREFCIDWTPTLDQDHPEGEGESKASASGMYSQFAVLPAP
jgi:hypothetical protein